MFDSFQVNAKSGVPVWLQIRNHLIFLIRSGKLKPGDTLPTVRDLAVRLGVNYNTIHKVYQDLGEDGLVLSSRGSRSVVAQIDPANIAQPDSPVDAVIKELVYVTRAVGIPKEDVLLRVQEALDGERDGA